MSDEEVDNLLFIDGTVNALKYNQILENELLPSIPQLKTDGGEYIFEQNGVACHTIKTITCSVREIKIFLSW